MASQLPTPASSRKNLARLKAAAAPRSPPPMVTTSTTSTASKTPQHLLLVHLTRQRNSPQSPQQEGRNWATFVEADRGLQSKHHRPWVSAQRDWEPQRWGPALRDWEPATPMAAPSITAEGAGVAGERARRETERRLRGRPLGIWRSSRRAWRGFPCRKALQERVQEAAGICRIVMGFAGCSCWWFNNRV